MKKKVCLCQGQRSKIKKTFSLFICFRIGSRRNLVSIETKVQKNIDFFRVQRSKKHRFLSGSKVKKTFSFFICFRIGSRKKLGLDRDQSSKKHRFLPGAKVKKTFSFFFCFRHWILGTFRTFYWKI